MPSRSMVDSTRAKLQRRHKRAKIEPVEVYRHAVRVYQAGHKIAMQLPMQGITDWFTQVLLVACDLERPL